MRSPTIRALTASVVEHSCLKASSCRCHRLRSSSITPFLFSVSLWSPRSFSPAPSPSRRSSSEVCRQSHRPIHPRVCSLAIVAFPVTYGAPVPSVSVLESRQCHKYGCLVAEAPSSTEVYYIMLQRRVPDQIPATSAAIMPTYRCQEKP